MARRKRNPWLRLKRTPESSGKVLTHKGRLHMYDVQVYATPAQLQALFEWQGGLCWWTGYPINPDLIFQSWKHLAPSLDRVDSSKGYTLDNIRITTRAANLARGRVTYGDWCVQQREFFNGLGDFRRKPFEYLTSPILLIQDKPNIIHPKRFVKAFQFELFPGIVKPVASSGVAG